MWLRRRAGRPAPPALLVAAALLVAVALIIPPFYLVLRALEAGTHLFDLLLTPRTVEISLKSLWLVASVTAAAVVVGVPLAWLTTRADLPLRQVWLVLSALPLVIPTYVGGFLLVLGLGPRGLLQQALAPLGVQRLPEIYGFPGALFILALHTYPYVLLSVRAALQRLDPALEETARSLGHGPWPTFWRVVLPQMRPAIAAGALLSALYALGDFGAVSMLNYETFTWAIFIQYESTFDRTLAAALSLVLVLFALGILGLEWRWRRPVHYHRPNATAIRPPAVVHLGRWRWPALLFCGLIAALAFALPVALLGAGIIQGVANGVPLHILGTASLNSVYVASLAAVTTVVAALPIAILTVRFPGPFSLLVERLAYVGFALPRIAIALGLVFFGARYAGPLYQTVALLVLAYMIIFLPTALGSATAVLRQTSPHLEEAARSLGSGPRQVLLRVTLPLIWPGVLAGAALVFLLTMEELPATLVLRPAGLDTLATATWSAASQALLAQAAVSSLLLILASSLALALMYAREERLP